MYSINILIYLILKYKTVTDNFTYPGCDLNCTSTVVLKKILLQ